MTVDSVVSFLVQLSNTDVARGILIAVAVGSLKNVPRFLQWLVSAICKAPERILMGALAFIDRRASTKSEGPL